MEKGKLELKCKVDGSPMPEVKWFRDNKEVQPTLKVKITKSKDVHTLTITGVTEKSTGGVYKVIATNKAGKAEHSANVEITGAYCRMIS